MQGFYIARMKGLEPSTFCMASGWSGPPSTEFHLQIMRIREHDLRVRVATMHAISWGCRWIPEPFRNESPGHRSMRRRTATSRGGPRVGLSRCRWRAAGPSRAWFLQGVSDRVREGQRRATAGGGVSRTEGSSRVDRCARSAAWPVPTGAVDRDDAAARLLVALHRRPLTDRPRGADSLQHHEDVGLQNPSSIKPLPNFALAGR